MARVAVDDWLSHCRFLQRVVVTNAKEGPISRLVLESFGILDRHLKSNEVTHELAFNTPGPLGADANQLLSQYSPVSKCTRLFVLLECDRIHVNDVEFWKVR